MNTSERKLIDLTVELVEKQLNSFDDIIDANKKLRAIAQNNTENKNYEEVLDLLAKGISSWLDETSNFVNARAKLYEDEKN
ncbi:hypothetical protein K2P47_03200 [Patescibacteria group bacterium]|nr:hypothetical protein [Patescibacteria group bacterium]